MKKSENKIKELLTTGNYKFVLYFIILSMVFSCKDDVVPPVEEIILIAKAGANQEVKINETVTLDGTGSTGPQGFTYAWTYQGDVPESQINFQNKNTAKPTFVPPANNVYSFTLTISYKDSTASDQTTVLAGGSIELGGTLTKNLELKNIQPDASKPDYIVKSDIIVPDGITLSIVEDDVVIAFDSGTGLQVNQGGTLTNAVEGQNLSFNTEFSGADGWKGILVNNGTINLNQSLFVNAGKTAFENQQEAAAITLKGDQTSLISFFDNEFINSQSYDMLVTDNFPLQNQSVGENKFSFSIPVKAVITFLPFMSTVKPNILPKTYDYIQLIPGGAEKKDESAANMTFLNNTKFYIDGNFWAGSSVIVGDNVTIYMKENCGILFDSYFNSNTRVNSPNIITGKDGKNWKGIASRAPGDIAMSYTTIENAGFGLIEIGDFRAKKSAAIYENKYVNSRIRSSKIINSGGYGYYNENTNLFEGGRIEQTLFKNTAMAAICVNISSVHSVIHEGHGNVFEMNTGVPAVLVFDSDFHEPLGNWYGLGGDNYYLCDLDFRVTGTIFLYEGVHLKITSGHAFIRPRGVQATLLGIEGTADNPVIIEGENDTPGSWGGMLLAWNFRVDNLIVKNGGQFIIPGGSEKANIVSNYNETKDGGLFVKNTTISNSAGWGIVVEPESYDFKFDDPALNNTFSNNASGDIFVKQ